MRVSIKDIARVAGVSHSTVSRALCNNPLVAEKTRRRIERIAKKKGYTPNAIARSLVTQRTYAIGVIVTSIADPFVAEVVHGIEESAANGGYRVLLGMSHDDPAREVNLVKEMREWRVDGVIVAASRVGALYQPLLTEIGVPIVLINSQHQGPYIHSIAVDDIQGACLAVAHLLSQGHRLIAHVRGPSDHTSTQNRLAGYQRALAEANLLFDPSLVLSGNGRADGVEQVDQLFSRSPVPTALFCYNDMTAIGVLRALKRLGLRVPEDVSLVGFDDILLASYVEPPLTTIHQPKDEMGQLATRMLLDLLNRKKVSNVMMSGRLILRESTRALAGY